jgi:hypothetical protein
MDQYPTTTVTIYREHDKICILEKYLNNNSLLETLVSKFIDHYMQNQTYLATEHFNKLKLTINNNTIFETIIQLALSIAEQTPYSVTIEVNDNTTKIIDYLKDTKIQSLF